MTQYLYRLFDSTDRLLYVGITASLDQRFQAHRAQKGWWPQVAYMKVSTCPTRAEVLRDEARAIRDEQPLYNGVSGAYLDLPPIDPTELPPRPTTYARLPDDELAHLKSLDVPEVYERAAELQRAGWSAVSILEGVRIRPTATQLRNELKYQYSPNTGHPVPSPPPQPREEARQREQERVARGMTPDEKVALKQLADLAKQHRAGYAPSHPYAVAVQDYMALILALNGRGVLPREMAEVAGVHEVTIRRRLRAAKYK